MKRANQIRVRTTSGERGHVCLDAKGNPIVRGTAIAMKLSGGVERFQLAETILPADTSKKRNTLLETTKDVIITSACHKWLHENPSLWQS